VVRRLSDDRIVGSTRFWDLEVFVWPPPWPPGVAHGPEPADDRPPSVVEIGSTWYAASAQRTGINTEVKLLQLTHAFEAWRVLRVTFKTDARSRTAIERLGAQVEGVRRAHSPAGDGTPRTTQSPPRSGQQSAATFTSCSDRRRPRPQAAPRLRPDRWPAVRVDVSCRCGSSACLADRWCHRRHHRFRPRRVRAESSRVLVALDK